MFNIFCAQKWFSFREVFERWPSGFLPSSLFRMCCCAPRSSSSASAPSSSCTSRLQFQQQMAAKDESSMLTLETSLPYALSRDMPSVQKVLGTQVHLTPNTKATWSRNSCGISGRMLFVCVCVSRNPPPSPAKKRCTHTVTYNQLV